MTSILICEDDAAVSSMLELTFAVEGYETELDRPTARWPPNAWPGRRSTS